MKVRFISDPSKFPDHFLIDDLVYYVEFGENVAYSGQPISGTFNRLMPTDLFMSSTKERRHFQNQLPL